MKNKHIKKFVKLDDASKTLMKMAISKYNLSARSYFRLIKVARTIADLDRSGETLQKHVAEALQYRIRLDK